MFACCAWCFELAEKDDRRYWSYKFQYTVYGDLVAASEGGLVKGGNALHSLAASIFGDAAYCSKQIKNCCRQEDLTERPEQGRPPTLFPRDVEAVLFRFRFNASREQLGCVQVNYALRKACGCSRGRKRR